MAIAACVHCPVLPLFPMQVVPVARPVMMHQSASHHTPGERYGSLFEAQLRKCRAAVAVVLQLWPAIFPGFLYHPVNTISAVQ